MSKLVEMFADLEIDDPMFKQIRKDIWDQPTFEKMMNDNPNLITLCNVVHYFEEVENEPGTREHKALLNLFKLLAIEFNTSKYMQSRLGWFIWFMVCYAKFDSYFPMRWHIHYDPLNWYRHDEPLRPLELERMLPEDPFNIQGKCFVHPEWYKDKKEEINEETSSNS